jgi:hypothetical protein
LIFIPRRPARTGPVIARFTFSSRKCHGSGTIPQAGEPRSRKFPRRRIRNPWCRTPGFRIRERRARLFDRAPLAPSTKVNPLGSLWL